MLSSLLQHLNPTRKFVVSLIIVAVFPLCCVYMEVRKIFGRLFGR